MAVRKWEAAGGARGRVRGPREAAGPENETSSPEVIHPRSKEGHLARNVDSQRVGPSAVLHASEVGNRQGTAVHAGENGFGRASASACSDRRWRQFPERVRNGHSRRLPTRRWIGKEAGGCVAGSARHAKAAPAEAWSTLGEVDLRVVGHARRQGIFRVHL